jgi:hypothetical protein
VYNNNYLFGKNRERERERENVVGIEQLPTKKNCLGSKQNKRDKMQQQSPVHLERDNEGMAKADNNKYVCLRSKAQRPTRQKQGSKHSLN